MSRFEIPIPSDRVASWVSHSFAMFSIPRHGWQARSATQRWFIPLWFLVLWAKHSYLNGLWCLAPNQEMEHFEFFVLVKLWCCWRKHALFFFYWSQNCMRFHKGLVDALIDLGHGSHLGMAWRASTLIIPKRALKINTASNLNRWENLMEFLVNLVYKFIQFDI